MLGDGGQQQLSLERKYDTFKRAMENIHEYKEITMPGGGSSYDKCIEPNFMGKIVPEQVTK